MSYHVVMFFDANHKGIGTALIPSIEPNELPMSGSRREMRKAEALLFEARMKERQPARTKYYAFPDGLTVVPVNDEPEETQPEITEPAEPSE